MSEFLPADQENPALVPLRLHQLRLLGELIDNEADDWPGSGYSEDDIESLTEIRNLLRGYEKVQVSFIQDYLDRN